LAEASGRDLALLRRLARLHGVQSSYVDQERRRVFASPSALLTALRALGAPVVAARDMPQAIRARQRELWEWRLEPVLVAWEGRLPAIELRLPAGSARGRAELTLEFEGGGLRAWRVDLDEAPALARRDLDRESYVAVALPGPGDLPLGYHRLTLEAAGRRLEARVIAAPARAYTTGATRDWGVFLPLYALHSRRSWGVGDLTDLEGLVDWAAAKHAGFVGTLPLLASFLDQPFDPSPYAPASRLFWNELFVDVTRVRLPGRQAGSAAGWDDELVREADALSELPLVAYRETMAVKRAVLEGQARAYLATRPGREALEGFLDDHPAVRDYARFRAAIERHGPNWRVWPERQRHGQLEPTDYAAATADYHAFAQWQATLQMQALARRSREKAVGLYFDLPVGCHADGYDPWRYQSIFVSGMSVGAPPDLVTTSGQDWGFEPLSPDGLRRSGYDYVIAYLRHHLSVASILRLDHVMGLHRLYWVPAGATARDGVYVRYRPEELYAVLCLESQRHQAAIVGENLGIVPTAVDRALARHAVSGMYVMARSLQPDQAKPVRPIGRRVIASFGTHDMSPFAAFWQGSDLDNRVRLGVLDSRRAAREKEERAARKAALLAYLRRRGLIAGDDLADVLRACLVLLAESPAERVLVNLEDLWLETRSQNVPATTDEHPNWRHKARYGLEELSERPEVEQALALVRGARRA